MKTTPTFDPALRMSSRYHSIISISSTSNFSVAFGGITGGNPRAPYACETHANQSD